MKRLAEELCEWSPLDNYDADANDGDDGFFDGASRNEMGIVRRGIDYLEGKYNASWNFILDDSFKCMYYLYTDVGREVMLGAQSNAIDVEVKWATKPVDVTLYTPRLSRVVLRPEFRKPAGVSTIETRDIQHATGFQHLNSQNLNILRELIGRGSCGQNKLTRLIKGVLLCLDIAAFKDGINVTTNSSDFQVYDVGVVCGEYNRDDDTAYFYCDTSYGHHFEVFGLLMMGAYPSRHVTTRCNVRIPADGKRCVALTEIPVPTGVIANLTEANTRASLLKYADDIGCSLLLERAIVIAGCLRENRYLSQVALPRVVSLDELIKPFLAVKPRTSIIRGWLSAVTCCALGRLFQCQMHVLVKDVLVASIGMAINPNDWKMLVESFFKYQKSMKEDVNFMVPLMSICAEMEWIGLLTKADYDVMLGYSIFESFWTMDWCKCVARGGVVKLLKQGNLDGMTGIDSEGRRTDYQVLCEELNMAKVDVRRLVLRQGRLTTLMIGFEGELVNLPYPKFYPEENPILLEDKPVSPVSRKKAKVTKEPGQGEANDGRATGGNASGHTTNIVLGSDSLVNNGIPEMTRRLYGSGPDKEETVDCESIRRLDLVEETERGARLLTQLISSAYSQNRGELLPYISFGRMKKNLAPGASAWQWNVMEGVTDVEIPTTEITIESARVIEIGKKKSDPASLGLVRSWEVDDEVKKLYTASPTFEDDRLVTEMKKLWRSYGIKHDWPLQPPMKLGEEKYNRLVNIVIDKLVSTGKVTTNAAEKYRAESTARDDFLRRQWQAIGQFPEAAAFAPFQVGYRGRIEWLLANAHTIRRAGLMNQLVGFEFAVVHANLAPRLGLIPSVWFQYAGVNVVAHECLRWFMQDALVKERVEIVSLCFEAMQEATSIRRLRQIVVDLYGEKVDWKNFTGPMAGRFVEWYDASINAGIPPGMRESGVGKDKNPKASAGAEEWRLLTSIIGASVCPVTVKRAYQMHTRWTLPQAMNTRFQTVIQLCPDYENRGSKGSAQN